MERRRRVRTALVLAAAGLAAAAVLPSQGAAARLKVRAVSGGVVVRLVGARPHSVRYTLGRHTVGRARRAPFNLVLYGYVRASRGSSAGPRLKLVARNGRSGRRLAIAALVPFGKPAKPSRTPQPTVSFTSTPNATTTSTSATIAFSTKNATSTSCSLDGAPLLSCTSPVLFSSLALGSHALTVLVANSAGVATAVASWAIVAPPPASPPPPGSTATAPVAPPSSYLPPPSGVTVYTSAQLEQALAAPTGDIVVADGVYDKSSPFVNADGHRVYAQHLGGAVFRAGFVMGGNWGPGHGLLQGLAFDVSDPSKVLEGSIVHIWGTGAGTQVLDTTLEGHGVIPSGLLARQVEGIVVRRVVARHFRDGGIIVDPNVASYTPTTPPVLEDVDASNVTWPTPQGSNGTAEACVWVGVKAVVRRLKARNCAWEGLWVGGGTRNSVFEDLDLNDTATGIYVEHFAANTTFRRIHAGPNVDRGVNCEWADPAWGSRQACTDDVFESSYFDTRTIGVYLDEGTTRTTVRGSVFIHQSCAAIGNYAGIGNLWDTTGNDYSGILAGAVPVYTGHLYSC
jgi:hypothetical protein